MIGAKKHPYATDSNERKNVLFILAILSVIICYGIYYLLEYNELEVSYWISIPSVFGVFGFLYVIFNEWLWRIDFLHKIELVKVPVINGKWAGTLKSSYDAFQTDKQIHLTIYQNWTEILIVLEAESSCSYSHSASIITSNPHCYTITYEYINSPNPAALESMHMHIGTTILEFKDNSKEIVGSYYSGRDRNNVGDITVNRTK